MNLSKTVFLSFLFCAAYSLQSMQQVTVEVARDENNTVQHQINLPALQESITLSNMIGDMQYQTGQIVPLLEISEEEWQLIEPILGLANTKKKIGPLSQEKAFFDYFKKHALPSLVIIGKLIDFFNIPMAQKHFESFVFERLNTNDFLSAEINYVIEHLPHTYQYVLANKMVQKSLLFSKSQSKKAPIIPSGYIGMGYDNSTFTSISASHLPPLPFSVYIINHKESVSIAINNPSVPEKAFLNHTNTLVAITCFNHQAGHFLELHTIDLPNKAQQLKTTINTLYPIVQIVFTPDNDRLLVRTDRNIQIMNISNPTDPKRIIHIYKPKNINCDGSLLAFVNQNKKLRIANCFDPRNIKDMTTDQTVDSTFSASRFSPKNNFFAFAHNNGTITLLYNNHPNQSWNYYSQCYAPKKAKITDIAFNDDETLLATISENGFITIFDIASSIRPVCINRIETHNAQKNICTINFFNNSIISQCPEDPIHQNKQWTLPNTDSMESFLKNCSFDQSYLFTYLLEQKRKTGRPVRICRYHDDEKIALEYEALTAQEKVHFQPYITTTCIRCIGNNALMYGAPILSALTLLTYFRK